MYVICIYKYIEHPFDGYAICLYRWFSCMFCVDTSLNLHCMCVVVCCSVLQCVAACCSVSQCTLCEYVAESPLHRYKCHILTARTRWHEAHEACLNLISHDSTTSDMTQSHEPWLNHMGHDSITRATTQRHEAWLIHRWSDQIRHDSCIRAVTHSGDHDSKRRV